VLAFFGIPSDGDKVVMIVFGGFLQRGRNLRWGLFSRVMYFRGFFFSLEKYLES
jgi:hypothetical protein